MPAHDTASSARADRPLLCYVVTEDWYFRSHREVLAQAALRDGYEVLLVTTGRAAWPGAGGGRDPGDRA